MNTLISDVTNSELTKVSYGDSIPEMKFDINEWIRCYGQNRPLSTVKLEIYYRDKCNKERKLNGLNPI